MQGALTLLGENERRVVWQAFPELPLLLPPPSSCQACLVNDKLPMVCFAALVFFSCHAFLFQGLIQGPY